ncbi:hypothetical protein D3C73_771070 [compost metagenome]
MAENCNVSKLCVPCTVTVPGVAPASLPNTATEPTHAAGVVFVGASLTQAPAKPVQTPPVPPRQNCSVWPEPCTDRLIWPLWLVSS